MLFDTHVHLDCLEPAGLVAELVAARAAGIDRFLVPGIDRRKWAKLQSLAAPDSGIYVAPGLHPQAAGDWDAACRDELAELLQQPGCVAIGEIGLDAVVGVSMPVQEQVLREQLRLAIALGRPVLLHARRTTGQVLEILKQEGGQRVGGIWHAFSGSRETAREVLKLGFALALGGPLTWPGGERAAAVARELPEEAIVLETDAPWRAPHPFRDQPNRPQYLALIAARFGELRGWSLEQTAAITTANAMRVLRLDKEKY